MLTGLRVLDASDHRGQLAGQILADLGADVILIEPPGGSPSRRIGPFAGGEDRAGDPDSSLWFWSYNRGKRSVVLDLDNAEDPTDRDRFLHLVRGADVLIEMTNDGYLGPTPVLRQHLANAVFRAVETNRPVLRVTNVGITAYINERGQVLDEAPTYQEATRVWSVSKSDGSQTFYVKYGDWFAWLSTMVTVILLGLCILRRREAAVERG